MNVLTIDPEKLDRRDNHLLQISLIAPRPIGWVSSISKEGILNLAPFSFFNGVSSSPPVVMVAVGKNRGSVTKDTAENILATEEFAVNSVTVQLMERMIRTSERVGPEVDEFELAGLTPVQSERIQVPRVKEVPCSMECVLEKHDRIYDTDLFFGRVVLYHIREDLYREGEVDVEKLDPLGRLGGKCYTTVGRIIDTSEKKQ